MVEMTQDELEKAMGSESTRNRGEARVADGMGDNVPLEILTRVGSPVRGVNSSPAAVAAAKRAAKQRGS